MGLDSIDPMVTGEKRVADALSSSLDGGDARWDLKDYFRGDKHCSTVDKTGHSNISLFPNFPSIFFLPLTTASSVFSIGFSLKEAGDEVPISVSFLFFFFFGLG